MFKNKLTIGESRRGLKKIGGEKKMVAIFLGKFKFVKAIVYA
jgi:hypothetical protein